MIEIFKTNIADKTAANKVLSSLAVRFPKTRFSLDLEDCDKVLRAEGIAGPIADLRKLVADLGYECEVLES